MEKTKLQAVPEWTELTRKTGLDPLGMQNAGVRLYQRLLPGISNVTLRVRYYGLYCWLNRHYARHRGSTDPKRWQEFLRRAEALYALVAACRGEEAGVSGSNWASRKLDSRVNGRIDFAGDAKTGAGSPYLRQAWGAYGAAYGSQLFAVDLYRDSSDHELPLLSPLGEELAQAFAHSASGAAKRFAGLIETGQASVGELRGLKRLSPSHIPQDGEESRCYRRLLFAQREAPSDEDLQRRRTLRLILQLGQRLGRVPWSQEARWCLYAGFLDADRRWSLDPESDSHCARWRIYQANDLSQMAFAAVLRFLLARMRAHAGGIALSDLVADAADEVIEAMEPTPARWNDFVRDLALPENALADVSSSERTIASALFGFSGAFSARHCVDALRLLAALHKRIEPLHRRMEQEFDGFDPDGFRTVLSEWRFMRQRGHLAMRPFLCEFFEKRVLSRHLSVAMKKMRYQRDYTFLFEADEGLVRHRDDYEPVATTPRLNSAVRFLQDLHLLGPQGTTALGLSLLEAGS